MSTAALAGPGSLLPLWYRLAQLQPHLCNGALLQCTGNGKRPTSSTDANSRPTPPRRDLFSFSCVVVPPPVPAARSAFEGHVRALVKGLNPVFITVTSYSPFFSREEEEQAEYADFTQAGARCCADGPASTPSAAQEAIQCIRRVSTESGGRPTPVVLTVTATRATFTHPEGMAGEGTGGGGPLATLTGASRRGIVATVHSFHRTLCGTPRKAGAAEERIDDSVVGGLMVLRGDDHGFTRDLLLRQKQTSEEEEKETDVSPHRPSSSVAPSPYRDFKDGTELLSCCHDTLLGIDGSRQAGDAVRRVSLLTGGYPQGHCLEKCWHPPSFADAESCAKTEALDERRDVLSAKQRSYAFLKALDELLAATNVPRRHSEEAERTGGPGKGKGLGTMEEVNGRLCETIDAAEKLLRRVVDGACRLYETPSSISPVPRASAAALGAAGLGGQEGKDRDKEPEEESDAEAKAFRECIRDGLVRPKLWPSKRKRSGDRSSCAVASVVVTQAVSSAAEFLRYADCVHSELMALSSSSSSPAEATNGDGGGAAWTVVVVPGLMAPLPAEEYTRTILQLKVVPSATLYRALRTYAEGLKSGLASLRREAASVQGEGSVTQKVQTECEGVAAIAAAITVFQQHKARLESLFEATMAEEAVRTCRELMAHGYTHVNWSCFSYRCSAAVTRIAQQLNGTPGGE